MNDFPSIVVLTGAGISAESGLATFRDNNGLWCNHRVEDVATPEAFARNPALVQDFYNMRRCQAKEAKPNAAHRALAKLAEHWRGRFMLVTQNVDDLHERALSDYKPNAGFSLIAMHGALNKARCSETGTIYDWHSDITAETQCGCCGEVGTLRPHIVWFGEMPLAMNTIYSALSECDVFAAIGTSGNVYPAAGFVHEVKQARKGRSIELNMEPSLTHSLFDETVYGPATQTVPAWVAHLLSTQK